MRRKERRTVWCACGCKTALETPDSEGRERRFISGHNGWKYKGKYATRWGACKRWAKKHPEKVRELKRRYHRQRKVKAILYNGGECWFCGMKYNGENAAAFEFHHRNPKTKEYNLGQKMHNLSWKSVLKELNKCSLSCANCHRVYHGGKF